MARIRLTDVLMSWGLIDAQQVSQALAVQQRWGKRIGQVLCELGFCGRGAVVNALAAQEGLKAVDVRRVSPDQAAVDLVPRRVAERCKVLPLRFGGEGGQALAVATVAPLDVAAVNAVRALTGRKVVAFIADEDDLERAIAAAYGTARTGAGRGIELRREDEEPLSLITVPLAACVNGMF